MSSIELCDLCTLELPKDVLEGITLFNAGCYFEAHEAFETAWRIERRPVRELYRAMLQLGVGYLKIERGNFHGARKMFSRARHWLGPFPDTCQGIDVAMLRLMVEQAAEELERVGETNLSQFDRRLFRSIPQITR